MKLGKTAAALLSKAGKSADKTAAYDGAREANAALALEKAGLVSRDNQGAWDRSGSGRARYIPGGYITVINA